MPDDSPWKPPAESGDTDGAPTPPPPSSEPTLPVPAPASPAPAPPAPAPPAWMGMPAPGAPGVPGSTIVPPPPPAGTPPPLGGGDPQHPHGDVVVVSSDAPERSRRSKWLVAGAATAAIAVGSAGVFAVANLAGTPEGGAATAADLGLTLLEAIENEDVLGVIDTLSPGERDVFRDPLVDLVDELTRLELLSTDADLARLLGVDVEFTGESASESPTNVGDIVNVDLRADAVITFDGAEVPIGSLVTDNLPDDLLTELRGTRVTETDELDIRLTAIEENGRWYFSVFHTIAELARAEAAPGSLIPAEGVGADGAESPDAAFDNALDQVESLDLAGMIRTLNPGEAAALQRYSPMFLEEAQAALDEVPLEWQITEREFRTETSGNTATVFIDAVAIEGTIDGESFEVSYGEGCLRAEGMGESFEQCQVDTSVQTQELLLDLPDAQRFVETMTDAFADMEEVGLEMRQFEGEWYVSPVTTFSEAMLTVLRALDRSEIDAIVEQAPAAFDDFSEAFFGDLFDLSDIMGGGGFDDFTTAESTADPVWEESEAVEETFEYDLDVANESAAWDKCYSITDPVEASDCFYAASVTDGVDPEFIPLALRFPECNYMVSWGGTLYELSDEAFIAAAEAARPCFLDLVEQGLVQPYELPTEIAYLECFEGRNWYNSFDDVEYDERYFACLEAAYAAG